MKTLWPKTFSSFWYQICPSKLKMVDSQMDPFPALLKFLIKQWLFMFLQYKTNSSSATTAANGRGCDTSLKKMPEVSCKTCGNSSSSSHKSQTFLIPWLQSTKLEAPISPVASLTPQGPGYVICHFVVCHNTPGTERSWPFITAIHEILIQRNNNKE